jgi:prevent-host-death family protein
VERVNIHEAKTHFSKLVERAEAGEEILIARNGKPVAKLVPFSEAREPRRLGEWEGKVWMSPDFDSDELNEEIWAEFWEGVDRAPDA